MAVDRSGRKTRDVTKEKQGSTGAIDAQGIALCFLKIMANTWTLVN